MYAEIELRMKPIADIVNMTQYVAILIVLDSYSKGGEQFKTLSDSFVQFTENRDGIIRIFLYSKKNK